jgi:phage-related tail protein
MLENLAQSLGVAAPVALIDQILDEVAAPKCADPVAAAVAAASRLVAALGRQDRRTTGILASMLADLALARRMGWPIATPLFGAAAPHISAVRTADADGYAKIVRAALAACARAREIDRRAARLLALAPKLRSKGAEHAIAVLLADDVAAAAALVGSGAAGLGSDRAARRLLERLVAQGGLRELTDRPTFRLYGL